MGKHRSVTEQRELVDLWHRSTGSMAAFARGRGIRPGTFSSWVKRHRPLLPALGDEPSFVQVKPSSVTPVAERFSVAVGAHALQFEAPPPADWFAAVLRGLSPC